MQVEDRPAQPRGWRTAAARRRRAAAARRRSARWRRRSGTSACWSGPAARGAARRAPCAAGSAGAPRSPRHPGPLRPGQHVRRVAAVVGVHRAALHLPRAVADLVQEPAVVGDDDQRGLAPRGQVPGQPGDALDVEVVGRLVEQQQVRVARPGAWPARSAGARRRTSGRPPRPGQRDRRSASSPPSRPVTTSRTRASPAHSWSAASPTTSARTVAAGSRSSCWPSTATAQAAGLGHPAVVERLAARRAPAAGSTCRRRCDRPRRSGRPRRRRARRRHRCAGAVAPCRTPSRLTRLRGHSGRRRPRGRRHRAVRARNDPQAPDAVSATDRSSACSWSRTRKARVGPEPQTMPPSAPY